MKRSFPFQMFLIFTLICLAFFQSGVQSVRADPITAINSISAAGGQAAISFADLGMTSAQVLPGPVSDTILKFNLPFDWAPTGSVTLDLQISAYFSSLVPVENASSISGLVGGDLSVYLNGTPLVVRTLQQSGDQTITFQFDSALFTPLKGESSNKLRIHWDGSSACLMNLLSSITILPASTLTFSYGNKPSILSLNDFPAPFIVENQVQPVPLKVLLPAQPTLGEMRAALIIAAGIGQLSAGKSDFEMVSFQDFHSLSTSNENIIVVASIDQLKTLPMQSLGLSEALSSGKGEGIVRLARLIGGGTGLIISGDEEGIIKAAEVVSADRVISGEDEVTMIVTAVHPPEPMLGVEDATLQDLGVGEMMLTQATGLDQSFDFYIPDGQQAKADSTFDLIISHSQQLDYLRSGLQVKLNGYPVTSLRLTDNTSNQNLFKLILPANLIHSGRNTMEMIAVLNIRDVCSQTNELNAWLRVSADSLLHLPLESVNSGSFVAKTLSDFPNSFLTGSSLENVTFVLSPKEFGNWQAAAKMAYQLGAALPGRQLLQIQVNWSNAVDPKLISGKDVILVGQPVDFTSLTRSEEFPALVFTPDNLLSGESPLTVVAPPAPGIEAGFLAIRGFSGESARVLLAVLGTDAAAVNYAADLVTRPELGQSNFAVVEKEGIQTSWMDQGIATGEIVQTAASSTSEPAPSNATQRFKQGMLIWVIPGLAVLALFLGYLVISEVRLGRRSD